MGSILIVKGGRPKATGVVIFVPYYKYSVLYHLEGLPPVCLLHGVDDELSPFSQSVELDAALTRRGVPHEFYSYEGLKHYFSTSADDATTCN
jgi:dipeptidyl aminopeptidase/acylaminoacyl peptidase